MTVDPQTEAQIKALLQQEVDWNFLIVTAHQHRVLPLVYRTLGRIAPNDVPELAMRRLRSAFHQNAKRNLFLTAELLQVMDIFRAHDIPCIPYKGPAVASLVYGDVSLRQFADLDIIVPVRHVGKARTLLISRGYRPEKEMSEEHLRGLIDTEKDITLLHDDLGITLEIHWGITTPRNTIRILPYSLWENLETGSIAGHSVQILRPENLLLILCIHGAKHSWERLGWLCDVAELVRSPGTLAWDRVLESASRVGGRRILFLGLALARELLGAEPPAHVLQAMQADHVLKQLCGQVKGWLFSEHSAPPDLGERERYFMNLTERSADRFRVAIKQAQLRLALTARDTEALSLPGFLRWSLYLLRPLRLAWEYGLTPFKRFFRGIFGS
jgi:Uncharacterised nucleotidyltransferase